MPLPSGDGKSFGWSLGYALLSGFHIAFCTDELESGTHLLNVTGEPSLNRMMLYKIDEVVTGLLRNIWKAEGWQRIAQLALELPHAKEPATTVCSGTTTSSITNCSTDTSLSMCCGAWSMRISFQTENSTAIERRGFPGIYFPSGVLRKRPYSVYRCGAHVCDTPQESRREAEEHHPCRIGQGIRGALGLLRHGLRGAWTDGIVDLP
jgi:hypothetical protein